MGIESSIIRKGHNAVEHLYGSVAGTYYGLKLILPFFHALPTFARQTRESVVGTPYLDERIEELDTDSESFEGGLGGGLFLGGFLGLVAQVPLSDFYWDNPHLLAVPMATNFASYVYETHKSKNKQGTPAQNAGEENSNQR